MSQRDIIENMTSDQMEEYLRNPRNYWIKKNKHEVEPELDIEEIDDNQKITNYFQIQVMNLFERVGTEGIFQRKIVIAISYIVLYLAFIGYMYPYLFNKPIYYCQDEDTEFF